MRLESNTIVVHVTEFHIRDGQRADCGKCPIALAVAACIGHYDVRVYNYSVTIGVKGSSISNGGLSQAYKLPVSARNFIRWFDRLPEMSDLVKPFSFEMVRYI